MASTRPCDNARQPADSAGGFGGWGRGTAEQTDRGDRGDRDDRDDRGSDDGGLRGWWRRLTGGPEA